MPEKYIMALDQGTTSSKTVIFDHSGQILSSCSLEFDQIYPREGWVEHDPNQIWDSQFHTIREALKRSSLAIGQIAAIGITNQRETTLVWDRKSGEPVYNAIVWQCRRTSEFCRSLVKENFDVQIRSKTGLIADAYFSGTKVKWILENVPGAREKAEDGLLAFGTIDTWLIYRLTGGSTHVTDYSNASRTLLYNIYELDWDKDILERFGIPDNMLPDVRPSSEIYAYSEPSLLGDAIPIAGIAGDQQAALFGQCCFEPGMIKNTYGTGCFLLMNTGKEPRPSKGGLLTTIAWGVGGDIEYALEGSVFIAGALIQWLRDELKVIDTAAESESLARQVDDAGGVYVVPAFTGLGAPYWDQYARGAILGLTRGVGRNHIVRASLESIAFQTKDIMDCMSQDSALPFTELRIDGGAAANNFLCQFQADILDIKVVRQEIVEITALGAAYLAGLAVDYWRDRGELKKNIRLEREFIPKMSKKRREKLLQGWQRAVDRSLDWLLPD